MLEFVVWKVEIVWKKLLVFIIQQKNMDFKVIGIYQILRKMVLSFHPWNNI